MPISPIILQRRHAELGRIRLGQKGDRGQPQKLDRFRFTSPSETYIRDLAELYGGEARQWDNGGVPGWEVITTAKSMPVVAVKGGLTQWMEFWQGGGCTHRCDGETNVLTGEPCDLDEQVKTRVRGQDVYVNPHTEAKPTTRLSVMLPELDAIGVWRLETHGWNAAAEIPAVAELATFVGDLVPAVLHLVERRAVKDGKTSRFVVPVLDLRIGQARLREVVANASNAELEAPARPDTPALEAPRAAEPVDNADDFEAWQDRVGAASSLDELTTIWGEMIAAGLVGEHSPATPARAAFADAFKARAHRIKSDAEAAPQPDADGAYEADVVEDAPATAAGSPPASEPDPDVVWQQILKAAADLQGWTLDQVVDDFKTSMGMSPDEASGAELAAYHHQLTTGEQQAVLA